MVNDERERRARQDLDRVSQESDLLGASAARRVADHFAARDVQDKDDAIEIWGRRIGRALSLAGVVILAIWLGFQLRWWG